MTLDEVERIVSGRRVKDRLGEEKLECDGWYDAKYADGTPLGRYAGVVSFIVGEDGSVQNEDHYLTCQGQSPDCGGQTCDGEGEVRWLAEKYHLAPANPRAERHEQLKLF